MDHESLRCYKEYTSIFHHLVAYYVATGVLINYYTKNNLLLIGMIGK